MPNSERKNETYIVSFQYPDPGNLLGTSEAMYADRDEAVAAAARASRDPENENIQVYHQWLNTEFNRTEGEWIDWRNTADLLPEYPETSCTTKAKRGELPKRNYDKENDLAVYVQCVERLGQLASIMNVYPKTMTLEQVKETIDYQLEKYRKLVIGQ